MRVRAFQQCGAALVVSAGCATAAIAQLSTEGLGSCELRFLVYDPAAGGGWPGAWVQSMNASPGQQVEWRVDVVYTGTRTDLFAMGEIRFQPFVSSADNTAGGDGLDTVGPWGLMDPMCDIVACTPEHRQDFARQGVPLPTYGQVNFGASLGSATGSNTLTAFRHSNGSAGAPPGDWIRLARSQGTVWPQPFSRCPAPSEEVLRNRGGFACQQQSQALAPFGHMAGMDVTVFRQALMLSLNAGPRVIELSAIPASMLSSSGSADCNQYYVSWQTGTADSGSHRTLYPTISPAFVFITGTACDPIDFNRDTLFPDVQDIADFLTVFNGGVCPTASCGDVDFNNDGLLPDTADVESLLGVFAGGPCV